MCRGMCISRVEVGCGRVVIERGESEGVSNFYMKVKVGGEVVGFCWGMIWVRNGVEIVEVRGVEGWGIRVG